MHSDWIFLNVDQKWLPSGSSDFFRFSISCHVFHHVQLVLTISIASPYQAYVSIRNRREEGALSDSHASDLYGILVVWQTCGSQSLRTLELAEVRGYLYKDLSTLAAPCCKGTKPTRDSTTSISKL